jgi:signal peptidase II
MTAPAGEQLRAGGAARPEGGEGMAARPAPAGVWRPAARYGYLALVALLTFVADQVSKAVVVANMSLGDDIPVVPPVLDLHYITNRGVAFGMFSALGDVFVPVAIAIMAVIFWYYRQLRTRRLWLRTALGLQLGGALGNLLDRLRYGHVIDFIEFHIDPINFHFAVFNLADSAIVVGVGILLVTLLFQGES